MQELTFILPLFLFLLLGVMSPGPSFIFVAQIAVNKSRQEAICVSIGMGIGALIYSAIASLGIFVLLENAPLLYRVLKVIGGIYLLFLAYKIWSSSNDKVGETPINEDISSGNIRMLSLGMLTQLSNPKTAIVFGGAFATFFPEQTPVFINFFVCILAFFINFFWYALVSVLLSTPKSQKAFRKFKSCICKVAGFFMGGMSIKLILND